MVLQEIWLEGTEWDESLSKDLQTKVKTWIYEMPSLSQVKIDRNINITEDSQIHTFVDVSSEAYGAVVYTCTEDDNDVNFVISKSRVAPLKSVSIPRLELMGAVLGLHTKGVYSLENRHDILVRQHECSMVDTWT